MIIDLSDIISIKVNSGDNIEDKAANNLKSVSNEDMLHERSSW